MFKPNKYTKWYFQITNRAKERVLKGYTEKHHIIPKSIGGSNDPTNIAILTAREHFICHYLLTKMVDNHFKKKMFNALNKMRQSKYTQRRIKMNSRQFEYLRKGLSENNKGPNNPMFGKSHTDDVKKRLSEIHSGKSLSPEHIARIKESNTGENNYFFWKITHKRNKRINEISLEKSTTTNMSVLPKIK